MLTCLLHLLVAAALASAAPSADVTAEFRARDQALLDAIAPGNVKLWNATLAPDAVYVDENGEVMDRAAFLDQLKPLPAGASGTIAIAKYSLQLSGDTATVIHFDDEHENYHGQALFARYLQTETWQRQQGEWKLLMVHCYSILQEPKSITLAPAELEAYTGRYTAAPDLTYVIIRDGDHLLGRRQGRTPATLQTEVRDVFFISGQLRNRKIFQRDSSGNVTGFIDRREGEDLLWKRLP